MDLAYDDIGQGDAVLLIHGGLGDRAMWDAQVPALAQRFRVIVPDLRGYGASPGPVGPVSHAEDLSDLLESLGIQSAHVVGLSGGGRIALDLALSHPDRVRSLVLIGSSLSGHGWSEEARGIFGTTDELFEAGDLAGAMEHELGFWIAGPRRVLSEVDQGVVDGVRTMMGRNYGEQQEWEEQWLENQRDRLGEIAVPALIVVGDKDNSDIQEIANTLAREIQGAQCARIPRAAHHPQMERPRELNELILEFLQKTAPIAD